MSNYKRAYPILDDSLLILGPRGVGKSTFVEDQIKPDLSLDLLNAKTYRKLSLDPSSLEELVAPLKKNQIVFIDEIQKIPALLDEVHRLIESKKIKFIMTGSSARKLKRGGANLLAGRALGLKMYPLTLHELVDYKINDVLKYGTLPSVFKKGKAIEEYLYSYVENYLKEEIFQESLSRNLNRFSLFTQAAGQYHGQILNYENISREIGLSGDTINSWFQILEDTLVGSRLSAYTPGVFKRENKHPKFYWFDSGVAWATTGNNFDEIPAEYKGYQFEALILNELRTYFEVSRKKYEIMYFAVPQIGDIDFIIRTRRKTLSQSEQIVTVEVKSSAKLKNGFDKMNQALAEKIPQKIKAQFAVYLGQEHMKKKGLEVLPLNLFIKKLWQNELF